MPNIHILLKVFHICDKLVSLHNWTTFISLTYNILYHIKIQHEGVLQWFLIYSKPVSPYFKGCMYLIIIYWQLLDTISEENEETVHQTLSLCPQRERILNIERICNLLRRVSNRLCSPAAAAAGWVNLKGLQTENDRPSFFLGVVTHADSLHM